ncbi:MAG: hypothetical protein IT448_02160 [Phycisphaerales bacterium]|nr:hypothetical protein [Phycisphaerales bacterium]
MRKPSISAPATTPLNRSLGAGNIEDVKLFLKKNKAAREPLAADERYGGGDFRSADCVKLLKQADIVVTNLPSNFGEDQHIVYSVLPR